jgi:hypothetical protein
VKKVLEVQLVLIGTAVKIEEMSVQTEKIKIKDKVTEDVQADQDQSQDQDPEKEGVIYSIEKDLKLVEVRKDKVVVREEKKCISQ